MKNKKFEKKNLKAFYSLAEKLYIEGQVEFPATNRKLTPPTIPDDNQLKFSSHCILKIGSRAGG